MIIDGSDIDHAWNDDKKAVAAQFEVVAELDEPGLSYEFHTLRVLRHKPSDRMFWGVDSGGSCPTPWEGFYIEVDGDKLTSTDFNEIVPDTVAEFERAVAEFPDVPVDEKSAMVGKVRAWIRGK